MKSESEIFEWIEQNLNPELCHSTQLIYDDMESQSCRMLPVIYQPFDAANKIHWQDRGFNLDYLSSLGGGRILDFGPGDGWPTLNLAPFVDEVVGVDASRRRIEVCEQNAARLKITNVRFVQVEPESPLPFEDDSFDGIAAASSIEQSPDPKAALGELFRILRPGGKIRIHYEALNQYKNGRELDSWSWQIDKRNSRLLLYNRFIDRERVLCYGLTFAMRQKDLNRIITGDAATVSSTSIPFEALSIPVLEEMRPHITEAGRCFFIHPGGRTLTSWLKEIGFSEVTGTHNGSSFAGRLFDQYPEEKRPATLDGVDAVLRPLVEIIVEMTAPIEYDPLITAVK